MIFCSNVFTVPSLLLRLLSSSTVWAKFIFTGWVMLQTC